jgi:hypothetical protein
MRCLVATILAAFLVITNSLMAEEQQVLALTPQIVTNLATQTDRLAMAGDVDAYSELLSDNISVTYATSPNPDELPHAYDRAEYLTVISMSSRVYLNRLCKTTISSIAITSNGQQADVEDTVVQECVSRQDGSVIKMTVSEKVRISIENGKPKILLLAGTVMKTSFEAGRVE